MEIKRRAGQGRVAEIAGPDLVGVDRFIRTLGLYASPQSSFAALSPWAQQRLQAYADGVNAFLDSHRNALPPEFLILGDKPEPWTPADSLVWGKLMSLQLSGNYTLEALRARLAQKLSPDRAAWLFPTPRPDWPVTTAPVAHADHAGLDDARDRLGALLPMRHGASNEWVVAGSRSDDRQADPRQRSASRASARRSSGISPASSRRRARSRERPFPGSPLVMLGQSDRIAWGVTNAGTDAQDLFVETIDPADPNDYLTPDGPKPFVIRDETIHVKGAPDVTCTSARRGTGRSSPTSTAISPRWRARARRSPSPSPGSATATRPPKR